MESLVHTINRGAEAWWPYVVHATWQATAVALVALVLVLALRRIPSPWRYGLLLIALVKFMMPPALAIELGLFYWVGPTLAAPRASAEGPSQVMLPAPAPSPPPAQIAEPVRRIEPHGEDEPRASSSAVPQSVGSEDAQVAPIAASPSLLERWTRPLSFLGQLSWKSWLMFLHACGTVAVVIWIVVGFIQLVTLSRQAQLVRAGPLHQRVVALAKRLDIQEQVELRLTADDVPPVAFWLLTPQIMIPRALVDRLKSDELDVVIAHELVHHRRNDWAANWLELVVCAAWWFNPVAWVLSRVTADIREECCDDALLGSGLTDASIYSRTLIRSAEQLTRSQPLGTTLGFAERLHPIAGRIRRIMDSRLVHAPKLSNAGLVAITLLAITVLPGLRSQPTGWLGEPPPMPDQLLLTVTDGQTGQPLPGASVRFTRDQIPGMSRCNEEGRAIIPYDASAHTYLGITVEAPGRVPMHMHFTGPGRVPPSASLSLPLGTPIGGIIRNDDGQPIEGVRVHLRVPADHDLDSEVPSPASIDNHVVTTDEHGRWRSDIMPARLSNVLVRLVHPQYVSDATFRTLHERPRPNEDQLRQLDAELVMYRGVNLAGVVMNETEEPVAGARIVLDAFNTLHERQQTTDDEGGFSFENVRAGGIGVTVEANGYAPQHLAVRTSRPMNPLEFRLTPGAQATVQVVDAQGTPLADALVRVQEWRGGGPLRREAQTDDQGYATLAYLPEGEVYLSASKALHRTVTDVRLVHGRQYHIITLWPALKVGGQVKDESGAPIPRFRVVPGFPREPLGSPAWDQGGTRQFTGGQYEMLLTQPHPSYYIRILADGYEPAMSRVLRANEEDVALDFYLRPASGPGPAIVGTVRAPDGSPAAGVEVVAARRGRPVSIQHGRILGAASLPRATTDSSGRFTLPPLGDDYLLVVADDRGYAEATARQFSESAALELQTWGRVEGQVILRGRPAHRQVVYVHPIQMRQPEEAHIRQFHQGTTDATGSFTFERVSPGVVFVGRRVIYDDDGLASRAETSHMAGYRIAPGQTLTVTVGGTGRPVAGRLAAPALPIQWSACAASLELELDQPQPPRFNIPADWYAMTHAQRAAWRQRQSDSELYQHFLHDWVEWRLQQRLYPLSLQADGSFHVDDVPPGHDVLTVYAYAPDAVGSPDRRRPLGRMRAQVRIEPTGVAYSDAVQDMGRLILEIDGLAAPGQQAPLFEGPTIHGRAFKLIEARGRYVLLHFYSSTSQACEAQVPVLRSVYHRYGGDERFIIVGLSADYDRNNTFAYLDRHELPWPQMWGTLWKDPASWHRYQLTGFPSTWLIDPDGYVIARDLRGRAIVDTVDQALGGITRESASDQDPAPPVDDAAPPDGIRF